MRRALLLAVTVALAAPLLGACVYQRDLQCGEYPEPHQNTYCRAEQDADAERDERYDVERRRRDGLPPNATP